MLHKLFIAKLDIFKQDYDSLFYNCKLFISYRKSTHNYCLLKVRIAAHDCTVTLNI